jgi:hypothetical protein
MNIGAIPVAELLAHIGGALLYPHPPAPAVATAGSSAYFPRFPYKEHIEMFMKTFFPTVS